MPPPIPMAAALLPLASNCGGRFLGISIPFSFKFISLHATENSLRSIFPSPFMSANPLMKLSSYLSNVFPGTYSPNLCQDHGRKSGLHEEAPGLSSSDEAVLGPDRGELFHVPHPLLGKDHPRIHDF